MRRVSSYLAFPPLLEDSVALVRGSPLAGVTRYPCPVEPGLSSRTGFRLVPAAVRLTRAAILIEKKTFVNIILVNKVQKRYNL